MSMYRTSRTLPQDHSLPWTLALAGGEGARLAAYVEQRFGERRPKQYCRLLGTRTMLEHTLDRLLRIAPPSQTLTVIGTDHARFALPQLAGRSDHVLRQPGSRDTGLALYVALAYLRRWAPHAIVTVTPCDHFVRPAARYVDVIRTAQTVATRMPDTIMLLGVSPDEPDADFGYIAPGAALLDVPGVRRVTGFVEKPSAETAAALVAQGATWNTMVTVGSVDALWSLGRAAAPQLLDEIDQLLVPAIDTPYEDDVLEHLYGSSPPLSFSKDILERSPERLATMLLDGVDWSDWGRPERIEATLAHLV
ncbi:MAG TPA: sugar phosphate nucleotidyltransferase [Kofleriaceae bacterium]